jgi:hypothetical protein
MALPSWPDDTPEHKALKVHLAHLAKKDKAILAAAGLVALADAGAGDAGPGAGAPGVGLPGETISEAAAGAGKAAGVTAKGSHAPKKIASAMGEAKFHGNIGDLIIPHSQEHWVAGQPGHMVHSISSALWSANQWKPGDAKQAVEQGTHHYVQTGDHTYAVHNGLEVHVPKDVDTSDEAQVKHAPKIVVKKGPNPEHVVLHPDTGAGFPVSTSEKAIGNLDQHYKKLPEPEPKKAVTIGGKHAAWVPHHWEVHKSAKTPEDKLTGKFAKDENGDWHYIGKTGKVEKIQPPTAANLDKWAKSGALAKEDHETHEPAPSHVAPTTPKAEKTTGAEPAKVDVGGVPATKDDIQSAISHLNAAKSTNVKGPLKSKGHPLADMDYMGISKAELAKYPELLVPKGTKTAHVGQVKIAVLHHLAGKLSELSATEAEQHITDETTAKAEAAAEHAQDLTPHTYDWGGKTATKEQLQEAADWLAATMGGKQSFSQAMKKTGNPLAAADYMGEAKKYKTAHPNTAKTWSTKKLMLESLKEHAGQLAKADAETGHDDAAELHAYTSQKVSALKPGWQDNPHGAVAAALLYAHHNKVNTYAFASHATPGTWEVDFSPPAKGYSWFTASPEHKVTMTIGGEQKDYAADMTLADAKSWIKPPGEAAPEPEKPPVAPPKEEAKPPKLVVKPKPTEPTVIKLKPFPKPEPEPVPTPEPVPAPVAEVPPEPPVAAEVDTATWKANPEYLAIHKLIVAATSKEVPGVTGDVDAALASGLWGAGKLEATRYILPKEGGGWKFSKTPGVTGAWGAPGEMYYRITPDHQVIFVSKNGTETGFTSAMVLKLAQLLAKKEEPKPEPVKPPEPEAKAPEGIQLPGVKGITIMGQAGDSTWQDTQEPEYGTYIKHLDGTWSVQYPGGGLTELGKNSALDNWIGNGLLKPLSDSAKWLAETSGAPKHDVPPDEAKAPLEPNMEPATKPVTIKGKEVGKVPADATLYWHHPTAGSEADTASYYVKYDDGSWGIFIENVQGDQGTSEPGKLNAFVNAGILVESGQPKPPEPAKDEEIPAILNNKVLGMVPAGSKFYTGKKPEYGYVPYYVLKPDGSWLESSYGNNLSKSYYGAGKKLEDGSIWEIPPPTAQQIADAKAIAAVKEWAHTAAISEADAQKGWKYQVAEKMSGKSHYASNDSYIYKYTGGKWGAANYIPHNSNEYWHFSPDSLKVIHHIKPNPDQPEGLDEEIPISEVIDAVKSALTPNAVTVGGKVYKFGFYYSPKGKAYVEVKEAKTSGKYHKYKYGKPGGTAAFLWHDTSGGVTAKTPAWAASQLEKNTEYWETEKPLVPSVSFANKYATVAEPGIYKLWSDAHGMNGSEHITIKEDGSALWQDPSTGEHGTLFGTTQSMEGGMVLDKYGTTVVEPGTMPAQYHLFGSEGKTYMELEAFRNQLQQTGGVKWTSVFWSGVGVSQDEAQARLLAWINDNNLGGDGQQQYHGLLGLMNELLNIPQQIAGAKAQAPAEVKFLKGLPPGIASPKDIFSFVGQGYAKPFAGSLKNDTLAAMGSPELADTIKAISAQYGDGKVVGAHISGLTKPERLAWIHAWKKGDMQAVFNLDAKGGKVSLVHPGAPENTATHHITWAPWDTGQIPASQTIDGAWSDMSVTPLKDEVDNYLIKVNVQNAAYLSVKERRALVKAHRQGDQEKVDDLSRTAWERKQANAKPLTAPPAWHDTLTPAKSYSVYLEDAKPAGEWSTQAVSDFVASHQAQLAPFAQQILDQKGSYETPEQWLNKSDSYYAKPAIQAYLDDEVAKAEKEALRPKWELAPGKPGYVQNQFDQTKQWFSGTKAEMGRRVAVNALARAFGFRTPKAEYAKLEADGTPGVITDEVKPVGTLDHLPGGLTSLEDRQLGDIAREHVLDYLLANPSSSAASHLIMGDKSIVSAGKPGAFTDLQWKGTDLAHLNDQLKQPVSLLFDAMKNGGVSKASADEAYIAAVRAAQRMTKLSDKRFTDALAGTGLGQAGIAALTDRKNNLVSDITGLWDKVYGQLSWTPPEVPESALEKGVHSGFDEVDGIEHLNAAKSAGVGFFFDEPGLANGNMHIWQEYNPQGHLDMRGEAVLRGKSLSNLIAWVKSHSGDSSKLMPKDEAEMHITILKAAQNVKYHWEPPAPGDETQAAQHGYFGGPETKKVFDTGGELDMVKWKLEARLAESEAALELGPASKEYQAALDKYGDPHAVISMAKQYLDQIQTVLAHKDSGTWAEYEDLPGWTIKGQVYEAAGGIKVEYPVKATRFLGTDTHTATEDTWQLDPKTGDLHLKSNLSVPYPGSIWRVTLPDGEIVDISDEAESGTPRAQWGRLRFQAVAENGTSSLANIRSFLQEAGLPMKEATQASMENLYWRLAANDIGDRVDRSEKTRQGQMWKALLAATGGSYQKMKAANKPLVSLIDDLVAMDLPAEEEAAIWREAMAHMASKEAIDKWVETRGYLPHFNHYSLHSKEVPGGKPIWYRFDVTPEQVAKKNFPANHLYHAHQDAPLVARSGGLFSSEARLRALGTHKQGMSWDSDQLKGSSGAVFLRQNKSAGQDFQVWVSPRVTAQLQSYSFDGDNYGDVAERRNQSYWDFNKHTQHTGLHNEIMIQDAISLLDDIEVLQAANAPQRAKIIKDLKSFGITDIRGLPVEERIVLNSGVSAALAKARKVMLEQAKNWFIPPEEDWSVAALPADATPAEKAQLQAQQAMDIESEASQVASEAGLTASLVTDTFGNEYVNLNVPVTSSATATQYTIEPGTIKGQHLSGANIQFHSPKWNSFSDYYEHEFPNGYTSGGYAHSLNHQHYEPEIFHDSSGSMEFPHHIEPKPNPFAGISLQEFKDIIAKVQAADEALGATGDGDGDGLDGPAEGEKP